MDVESAKNESYIAVDSNGTQNESVVQDVVFDAGGASGTSYPYTGKSTNDYTNQGVHGLSVNYMRTKKNDK